MSFADICKVCIGCRSGPGWRAGHLRVSAERRVHGTTEAPRGVRLPVRLVILRGVRRIPNRGTGGASLGERVPTSLSVSGGDGERGRTWRRAPGAWSLGRDQMASAPQQCGARRLLFQPHVDRQGGDRRVWFAASE